MRVVLSTISKFHSFDLARELERHGVLEHLFTGRPRWKLRDERLPLQRVSTYPVFQTVFEASLTFGLGGVPGHDRLHWACHQTLDRFVEKRLPASDVFCALAYCGLQSGRRAQELGGIWVCDAPTEHAACQEAALADEHLRLGLPYRGTQDRLVDYEVRSYERADAITIPSRFAKESFVRAGIPAGKLHVVPYGVDTGFFAPVSTPRRDTFRVLFVGQMSLRKGLHDLLAACRLADIPGLELALVGPRTQHTSRLLGAQGRVHFDVRGPQPRSCLPALFAQADVMVLPSISDAYALVVAQALSSGCPVITTDHNGSSDLIVEAVNGFVVPARSPERIADRLVWLAEHPPERRAMRKAARESMLQSGGWRTYGARMVALFTGLVNTREDTPA